MGDWLVRVGKNGKKLYADIFKEIYTFIISNSTLKKIKIPFENFY